MRIGASGATASDPCVMKDVRPYGYLNGGKNPAARTQVNRQTLSGTILTGVFVGQSNNESAATDGFYTPSNPTKVLELNPYDGGLYQTGAFALLGTGNPGSACCVNIGDKLVTDGKCDYFIIVNGAVGGSSIDQWANPAGGNTGVLFHRLAAIAQRLSSLGLTPSFIDMHQGETDNFLGTNQTNYANAGTSFINGLKALWACKIIYALATYYPGLGHDTSAAIRAAQAGFVDSVRVFQGFDTDTLTGATNRLSAGASPDLNTTGMASRATGEVAIIKTVLGL